MNNIALIYLKIVVVRNKQVTLYLLIFAVFLFLYTSYLIPKIKEVKQSFPKPSISVSIGTIINIQKTFVAS